MPPAPSPRRRASAARFCRAVSEGYSPGPSTKPATPSGSASVLRTGLPRISRSPPSASARPRSRPNSVVFPAPFGPTRPCTWPCAMSRSTPSRATTSPKALLTPRARTATDGPPENRRAVASSVRVRAGDVATRNLRGSVDLRVTRVGHLPVVGLVPRVPVHLLGVRVIGARPAAGRVLLRDPRLPRRGRVLLVRWHHVLLGLRL